jgi:hypothetical protein
MSDPPAINPFVNEDGGGYYDGEGDYVPGPDAHRAGGSGRRR